MPDWDRQAEEALRRKFHDVEQPAMHVHLPSVYCRFLDTKHFMNGLLLTEFLVPDFNQLKAEHFPNPQLSVKLLRTEHVSQMLIKFSFPKSSKWQNKFFFSLRARQQPVFLSAGSGGHARGRRGGRRQRWQGNYLPSAGYRVWEMQTWHCFHRQLKKELKGLSPENWTVLFIIRTMPLRVAKRKKWL